MADKSYATTFADSFLASSWYGPEVTARELRRKCDEIVADAADRQIRTVRFEVAYADEHPEPA